MVIVYYLAFWPVRNCGLLVKTRTTFAAIRVFNRHWGVFTTAYKM